VTTSTGNNSLSRLDGASAQKRAAASAARQRARVATPRLGQMLVERGVLTDDDLDRALEQQRSTHKRLGEVVVEMGMASDLDVARVLADHFGVLFVDLDERAPDFAVTSLISEEVARRYRALPIERWSDQIVVAMANPGDVFALDDIRVLTGKPVVPVLAAAAQLAEQLDRVYQRHGLETQLDDAEDAHASPEFDEEAAAALVTEDGPVVRLVNALLEQAVSERASDVHVEPTGDTVNIRLRIDGVLHDVSEAAPNVLRPLVSRLKVLGGLDIAQRRVPQDGRFSLSLDQRSVDVRVATVPTVAGEAVVLRLLDPQRGVIDRAALGMSQQEESRLLPAVRASQGAVVVTGPTGSGKSSTVYALASEINTRDKSIVSVEDPVEYRVDGIKQIQINTRAGMTFPSALRSILRSDPDVIVIGEVRDSETARIAADASITGHLVFSTLHAHRAAAAPARLIEMGVEPYLVATALTSVVAQRLVRRLCEQCAAPLSADLDQLRHFGADESILDAEITMRRAVGCSACLNSGYRGRSAVFEILTVTEELAHLVVQQAASAEIERLAVAQGMDTMRSAALRRVVRGELTLEEVARVLS
jgi:type IV pilus assembly protein PilB